jgi:ubiquinone biosynthesis protein
LPNPSGEIARPHEAERERPERRVSAFGLRRIGLPQALRLAGFAIGAAWDACAVCARATLVRQPAAAGRAGLAERIAARAVLALGALKGIYAKLGQFAAIRLDLLPEGATQALASLRDRVPPLPAPRVRRFVEAELGAPIRDLFAEFDDTPLGAASIAQVHRARLPGGEEVAVKVQYPWLEASLPVDLKITRALIAAAARLSGRRGGDSDRLFQEFASGLRDELDFEREARVAQEIARNLAGDERVVVPEVRASHSTRRVLTMRYHAAVGLADRDGLARLGVAPRAVLEILARAYASQVFVDGLFHADPHPGNLFVIDEPGAAESPRVLFVDFGLSRRLDPALRHELRLGLYALMQRDLDGFIGGMQRMQMIASGAEPGVRVAVREMFDKISAGGGALALAGGQILSLKDEAKVLLQETPGLQLPNDLLLYAKTLSYLFALGTELDPSVDMMKLCLPSALRFLAQREA